MHEALLFSAQLRLIDVSKDKMRRFVDEVGPPLLPLILQPWRVGPGDIHLTASTVSSGPIWRRVHYRWLTSLQCGQRLPMRNPVFTDLNMIPRSFTPRVLHCVPCQPDMQ